MSEKKTKFTAVYEQRGKWFVGYVREVPNAHSQGKSLKEVKANLRDALDLVLKVRRQLGRSSKPPSRIIREPIRARVA